MRGRTEFQLNYSTSQRLNKEKSARELRQGGSNYRCCIPALAGFVSLQSMVPDGKKISSKIGGVQFFCAVKAPALTGARAFDCIGAMNWLAVFASVTLCVSFTSCTTLATRRDLYSPEPGPDSYEARKQWASTTTTTETVVSPAEPAPQQMPQFR